MNNTKGQFITNLFSEYLFKNNETFNLCDGKITFTKLPNTPGYKIIVSENIIVNNYATQKIVHNVFYENKNNYPSWLTVDTYCLHTGIDWIDFSVFFKPEGSTSFNISSRRDEQYLNLVRTSDEMIIRFELKTGTIDAGEYEMYPAIYKITGQTFNRLLYPDSNNYFKNINYRNYLDSNSDPAQLDLNKIIDTGFLLLTSGAVYLNAPAEYNNNIGYYLEVYCNYNFIYQKLYPMAKGPQGPEGYYVRYRNLSGNWSAWTNIKPINLDNFKANTNNVVEMYKGIALNNYESTEGYYYAYENGNSTYKISSNTFSSALIPTDSLTFKPKYITFKQAITYVVFLNKDKDPVTYIGSASINFTNPNQDYNANIQRYYYKIPDDFDWSNIAYIALTYNKSSSVIYDYTFATHLKAISLGCQYEEDELIIINGKIINKTPTYELQLNNWKVYMGSILDNSAEYNKKYNNSTNETSFISYTRSYFPAGTKINCLPSAGINITLRGFDTEGYIYYSVSRMRSNNDGWGGFIIPRDTYANITCSFSAWNHWGDKFDMTNLTNLQRCQFITVQSPEEINNNPWKDLNWYAYGTSISDVGLKDTTGNNGHSGKYPLYLDMHSGLVRHNGAIGSGGILNKDADNGRLNVKKNILSTPADADLVTLEILPNDAYGGDLLGDIDDTDNSTICGNLNQCLDYLVNNTHARIVLIFVTISSAPNNIGSSDPNKPMYDSLSATRKNYRRAVNKLKELAELYGVYCIDVDKDLYAYEQRNWGNLFADWIHPSYLGGWLIGRYIWTELKEIGPMPKYPDIDQTKSTMEWSTNTSN